jgi:F-type H+-transporting ATPase subunit epsilon
MANTQKLEIVTPDGVAYSEDIEMVTFESVDGELGVLPGHTPLMTQLQPGQMTVLRGGREELLAVGGGLVVVTGKLVAILTDMAIAADKIDEAKVEEARQRAEARLREKASAEEIASLNATLARSLAQLKVKKRHHV